MMDPRDTGNGILHLLRNLSFESPLGDAPNCVIKTVTRGTSTFGYRVIGSLMKLRSPIAAIAIATTIGGIGCRIDHAETFTAIRPPSISLVGRIAPWRSC